MKLKITALSIITLISSCSNYQALKVNNAIEDKSSRIPSSSVSSENLNKTFEILMSSDSPEKEINNYLDRIRKIYIRAEVYMSEFDNELKESEATKSPIDFENSTSYKKLQVMRELKNRMINKMTYIYLKLVDVSNDSSQDQNLRKVAKNALKQLKSNLKNEDSINRIAFDDLKIHIQEALKSRQSLSQKIDLKDSPTQSFKNLDEQVKLIRKIKKSILKSGEKEVNSDDELNQLVSMETSKLKLVDTKERIPAGEKMFYPSTTSSGNVMGLVFPKGVWALTYDDGPHPTHTPNIIKNLNELDIKATFFWLAENVLQYQSIVDLVGKNNFPRENHSWSHPQLTKISSEELYKEINKSTEVEEKAYGQKVEFFRCPYGAGNSVTSIRQRIADLGMIHVFWNVDTLDWQDKDPDSIVERAKKQMNSSGHGVILFHDIHPQSVIASKKLVEWSKQFNDTENKIRWVTLPEIVNEMNGNTK